MYGEGIRVLFC